MTDGSQFLDIILFAMVAVFLGLRLRSVLGRRSGSERPPADTGFGGAPSGRPAPPSDSDGGERRRLQVDLPELPPGDTSVNGGLAQIGIADSAFNPAVFADGARKAFELIVRAFAQGDEGALKGLLSDEVFENFSHAIEARRSAGETCESQLVRTISAEIAEARMDGRTARIAVRFVSDQVIVVRDAQGRVVEGDPNRVVQLTDLWSFARDTRSPNPNWLLVATRSHDEE
jgi:predicted lipid-binding transport protein (Tim44 family)